MRLSIKKGLYYIDIYDHKSNFNLNHFLYSELEKYGVIFTTPSNLCCINSLFLQKSYIKKAIKSPIGYINFTKWLGKQLVVLGVMTQSTYDKVCCNTKKSTFIHADVFFFKKEGKLNKWLANQLNNISLTVTDPCCI